jgi:hypothetical protein
MASKGHNFGHKLYLSLLLAQRKTLRVYLLSEARWKHATSPTSNGLRSLV